MDTRSVRHRWTWRRTGLTCLTAVGITVLIVLAWITVADGRAQGHTSNADDRVFTDFDSPLLRSTNDGTPLTAVDNGRNASGLAVVDSELTHGAPTASNAAGYLEARMAAPVSRIGAVAEFHAQNSGAIGLISSADSIAEASREGIDDHLPSGGMVFAATTTAWHFGVWDSAAKSQQVLLSGTLTLPSDGSGQGFELVRYGDTVTIRLPDGSMHATSDSRIADWSGPWASWELYELDASQAPVTLSSAWAS